MEIVINWSHKRAKHATERMKSRGISRNEIIMALGRGEKKKQFRSGLWEVFFADYSLVFDEYINEKDTIRKVYPVKLKRW